MTNLKPYGVCVAYSQEIKSASGPDVIAVVVKKLIENKKAKVVAMFLDPLVMKIIGKALEKAGFLGHFILVASDTFIPVTYTGYEKYFKGTFSINLPNTKVTEFESYYESISPWRVDNGNPWFGEFTEKEVGCVWKKEVNYTDILGLTFCDDYRKVSEFRRFYWTNSYAVTLDIITTYALALDNLIQDKCPEAFGNRNALRQCVTGQELLTYIRNIKFDGYLSHVEFDEFGDVLNAYDIKYFQEAREGYVHVKVGEWSRLTGALHITEEKITWYTNLTDEGGIPTSICAKPCGTREFYLQGELECCWECRTCRDNEKLRDDLTGCDICPKLTWPDENATFCVSIPLTFMLWTDTMAIGLESLSAIGLLSTLIIIALFNKHSDKRIIRGSSRELMVPILLGLLLAYITVYGYLTKPTDWSCYAVYFGFHLSCTLIFAPLFLKTIRMYRIFDASEKCQQRVSFLGALSQVVFMGLILTLQVRLHN